MKPLSSVLVLLACLVSTNAQAIVDAVPAAKPFYAECRLGQICDVNLRAFIELPDRSKVVINVDVEEDYIVKTAMLTIENLHHTYMGDLQIQVDHEGRSVVVNQRRRGVDGAGRGLGGSYVFRDSGETSLFGYPHKAAEIVPGGTYTTDDGANSKTFEDAFGGRSARGEWVMSLEDFLKRDEGSLDSFTLTLVDYSGQEHHYYSQYVGYVLTELSPPNCGKLYQKTNSGGLGGEITGTHIPVSHEGGEELLFQPDMAGNCTFNFDIEIEGQRTEAATATLETRCGNGNLDPAVTRVGVEQEIPAEECDDGNVEAGDGCSPLCIVEEDYHCQIGQTGASVCDKCGNGVVLLEETCDDENTVNGDGCSYDACQIEDGWSCTGSPSICALCGDGVLIDSIEQCDDGNTKSGDGCSDQCMEEEGWMCHLVETHTVCTKCSNGVVSVNEECDDGNKRNGDGCSTSCNVESGWHCETGSDGKSVCGFCGNGVVELNEQCDDGNRDNGDGCSSKCTEEENHNLSIPDHFTAEWLETHIGVIDGLEKVFQTNATMYVNKEVGCIRVERTSTRDGVMHTQISCPSDTGRAEYIFSDTYCEAIESSDNAMPLPSFLLWDEIPGEMWMGKIYESTVNQVCDFYQIPVTTGEGENEVVTGLASFEVCKEGDMIRPIRLDLPGSLSRVDDLYFTSFTNNSVHASTFIVPQLCTVAATKTVHLPNVFQAEGVMYISELGLSDNSQASAFEARVLAQVDFEKNMSKLQVFDGQDQVVTELFWLEGEDGGVYVHLPAGSPFAHPCRYHKHGESPGDFGFLKRWTNSLQHRRYLGIFGVDRENMTISNPFHSGIYSTVFTKASVHGRTQNPWEIPRKPRFSIVDFVVLDPGLKHASLAHVQQIYATDDFSRVYKSIDVQWKITALQSGELGGSTFAPPSFCPPGDADASTKKEPSTFRTLSHGNNEIGDEEDNTLWIGHRIWLQPEGFELDGEYTLRVHSTDPWWTHEMEGLGSLQLFDMTFLRCEQWYAIFSTSCSTDKLEPGQFSFLYDVEGGILYERPWNLQKNKYHCQVNPDPQEGFEEQFSAPASAFIGRRRLYVHGQESEVDTYLVNQEAMFGVDTESVGPLPAIILYDVPVGPSCAGGDKSDCIGPLSHYWWLRSNHVFDAHVISFTDDVEDDRLFELPPDCPQM